MTYPINNNRGVSRIQRSSGMRKRTVLQCPYCKVEFGSKADLEAHKPKCEFRPKTGNKVDYRA
jgi:hypothetical protein